jgi:hypothetical protein
VFTILNPKSLTSFAACAPAGLPQIVDHGADDSHDNDTQDDHHDGGEHDLLVGDGFAFFRALGLGLLLEKPLLLLADGRILY